MYSLSLSAYTPPLSLTHTHSLSLKTGPSSSMVKNHMKKLKDHSLYLRLPNFLLTHPHYLSSNCSHIHTTIQPKKRHTNFHMTCLPPTPPTPLLFSYIAASVLCLFCTIFFSECLSIYDLLPVIVYIIFAGVYITQVSCTCVCVRDIVMRMQCIHCATTYVRTYVYAELRACA